MVVVPIIENEELAYSYDDLSKSVLPGQRKRILVIDDDQDFRLSLCEFLVDEGFMVGTARDVDTALAQLMHQTILPDLILIDMIMPGKSGVEFRREQLKHDILKDIPVVFVTGQGYVEGESCLLKPFDERELLSLIKQKTDLL